MPYCKLYDSETKEFIGLGLYKCRKVGFDLGGQKKSVLHFNIYFEPINECYCNDIYNLSSPTNNINTIYRYRERDENNSYEKFFSCGKKIIILVRANDDFASYLCFITNEKYKVIENNLVWCKNTSIAYEFICQVIEEVEYKEYEKNLSIIKIDNNKKRQIDI